MSDQARKPEWLRRPAPKGPRVHGLKSALRGRGLHTVCESARCPNIVECFSRPTATFMIMGDACTRRCTFCGVAKGDPAPLDPDEPRRLAEAALEMRLAHVVITSVTRDDLPDRGAAHFRAVCERVRERLPHSSIEVLVPDFMGSRDSIEHVVSGPIDVFNHNLETVPRLYPTARTGADYNRSLDVLRTAKLIRPGLWTKSGLMVGLGETVDEVHRAMDDLVAVGCDAITVGQYIRPRLANLPVVRYWEPAEFEGLEGIALSKGFRSAFCGPLVRSSYHAEEVLVTSRCVSK